MRKCHCGSDAFSLDILDTDVRERCLRCLCLFSYVHEGRIIAAPDSCLIGIRLLESQEGY